MPKAKPTLTREFEPAILALAYSSRSVAQVIGVTGARKHHNYGGQKNLSHPETNPSLDEGYANGE